MSIEQKTFAAYQVLTADDVNNYLMNQAVVQVSTVAELASVPTAVNAVYCAANGWLYARSPAGTLECVGGIPTTTALTLSDTSLYKMRTPPAVIEQTGNRIRFRGGITSNSGTFSAGANSWYTFATLPAGMRPTTQRLFLLAMTNGSSWPASYLQINTDGTMQYLCPTAVGPGFTLSLDGIEFYAGT